MRACTHTHTHSYTTKQNHYLQGLLHPPARLPHRQHSSWEEWRAAVARNDVALCSSAQLIEHKKGIFKFFLFFLLYRSIMRR